MKSNTHAERRKFHIIYKTTCVVTGRWYIGLHSTDDINDGYRGSGGRLKHSLNKYGKDQHTYEVLEYLKTRKDLVQREIELITEEMLADPMCMNLMLGGGREIHSNVLEDLARKKISITSKEMWARRKADPAKLEEHLAKLNKPEHIIKRAAAVKAKGHKRTPTQLSNLSAGQTKYYSSIDQSVLDARGAKGAAARAKTWIVEDLSGSKQFVKDLVKFSEANGIKRTALYKTERLGTYRNGFRIVGRQDANI